jgi:transposase InsO family protein
MGDTETIKGVDSSSPYYLHPSANTDRIISPVVLRGNNYNEWARSVRNALKANNKLGFIDGSIQPPKSTEATIYSAWVQVNSMLGAWLHNTLDASIRSTVPITDDVREMWEDIRQRFSVGNGPRIHELTSQLTRLEQGGDSVVDYFGKIRMIWDELQGYSAPACTCSCKCGAKGALVKEREDQKVHQFLIGLDSAIHGTVRSQILMQEPLPPLNTVFSKALTEERHHSIVRQSDKKEAVGFAVQGIARGRGAASAKEGDKPRFTGTCSHCNKVGHAKDNCFQLLGFPDWWYSENRAAARGGGGGKYTRGGRSNGRGRGNMANAVGQSSGSTSDQYINAPDRNGVQLSDAQWHHLLGMLKTSPSNAVTPTHDGKYKATQWIIDTGCSNHMTGNVSLFESLYDISPSPVGLPNGNQTTAIKEGRIVLSDGLILTDVLYVPDLNVNLISVSQLLATLNYFLTVTDKLCIIQDRNSRTLIGAGEQCDGVYWFKSTKRIQANQTTVVGQHELWHRRLGHPSRKVVNLLPFMSSNKAYRESNDVFDSKEPCGICMIAHQTRSVFPISGSKTVDLFEMIHCDIWGAYKVASSCGAYYFLTIVDDFSRAVWVYLMSAKSEVGQIIKDFCSMVQTQFHKQVKILRSDNGHEFTCLHRFYAEKGMLHQTSCVDTPQQNGRVERKHQHLLNVARALRFQANLPLSFWGDCVLTAAYVINRTPSHVLHGKSPYDVLFGKSPNYSLIRTFGSLCYAHYRPRVRDKFGPRSRKCIFVGYPFGQKGWRLYDLERKVYFVSRDVIFLENNFPFNDMDAPVKPNGVGINEFFHRQPQIVDENPDDSGVRGRSEGHEVRAADQLTTPPDQQSPPPGCPLDQQSPQPVPLQQSLITPPPIVEEPLGKGHRIRIPSTRLKGYITNTIQTIAPVTVTCSSPPKRSSGTPFPIAYFVNCDKFSVKHRQFLAAVTTWVEPKSYSEAVKHPGWRNAMRAELDALERQGTWTLESLPPGKVALGSMWVYKAKLRQDGSLERLKGRLVVFGNRQLPGIDFHETFAPVAKMVTVRIFLAVAITRNWELHQMDVHNAFLHGDLEEEVYMKLPPGYAPSGSTGKVCRLRKALYGLRQAPRQWFAKLSSALKLFGFKQSTADYSLFCYTKGDVSLYVLVYVDDLLIAGSGHDAVIKLKAYLRECFHMKDLGVLKYFLGIEVARGPDGLFLNQRKYVLDIISEAGLLGSKPISTPMDQNHQLARSEGELFSEPEKYRRLVGRLVYLTITRPELSYSVHVLAQFMSSPMITHWEAALRVLRYLKGCPGQGILLHRQCNLQIYGFCDSDWAACPLTRRSLTGYFVLLGSSPISWKTKKQPTVSRSSAEAEYRSMATTTCELKWLKSILVCLGVRHDQPMRMYCDSQAALHIAANPVFHERTKHIEMDCHFVRDELKAGTIATSYIRTGDQLADIFTKALGKSQFLVLLRKLGIRNLHAPT